MNELDRIGLLLTDLPIYLANGALVILYWLAAHMPALTSLVCALLMAWLPDAEIQQRAGFRPRRSERGSTNESSGKMPRTAQVMTGMVLVAWIIAPWDMGAPVPWIGAAMWAAGLAAILALPAQPFNPLWYVKAGIAL